MPSYFNYAPMEVQNLPFNALRSQLWPPNPPTAEQAIQDALSGQRPGMLLPQKMGFTRWKNGPASQEFAGSARSVYAASQVGNTFISNIAAGAAAQAAPTFIPQAAAADINRLPQAMDNYYADNTPVARGLLNRPVAQAGGPGGLNEYAAAAAQPGASTPVVYQDTLLSTAAPDSVTPLGKLVAGLGKIGTLGAPGDAMSLKWRMAFGMLGTAGVGLGAYHGYKRNRSVGGAVLWGILGGIFPIFTIPVAFAQGFGKRRK